MTETINATKLNPGVIFKHNNVPYRVHESQKMSVGGYGGNIKMHAENLLNGKVVPLSFKLTEKFEIAEIEYINVIFIYNHRNEFWFHKLEDKKARFSLTKEILRDKSQYLKQNLEVQLVYYNDKIIDIILPITISYKVKSAPPAIKGNTAQGGTKQVILENDLAINVPLFINDGDIVTINTQTGEYSERVEKA